MCPYKYNPLLPGKLDLKTVNLNDLEDVNTAGTVDGYVLAWEQASGTWKPSAAGVGDMLKSDYVTGQGTVYNASRLEENTLGSVRDHNVVAVKITSGTIGLARIPSIDDARIPNLETLSYGGTFAEGQIPNLAASKITSGTFNVNRIDTLDNLKGTVTAAKVAALDADKITTGTFGLARVPTMDDAHIPDLETLSYGATFGTAQIPSLGAYKIASGTLNLARIPSIDDGRIPDLETLSYGAAFGTAQIPSLGAYKIASGTLNADRIPALPTSKITSGTFNADRIPILPTDRYGSAVLVSGTRSMTGDLDFAKHQAKAMAFEVLGSAPASPATAQMYYNSGDDKVYVYVA